MKDLVLLDVTPLSLGVETLGRVSTRLVERNTTIPTKKTQIFTTAADGQTSVEIHVLQGEREMAADNTTLGRFHLIGIPPAPRGIPQIEVSFDIDANGILNVSAKDLGTGQEQAITITASTKLKQDEIDSAMKEAEKYAEEDAKKREEVEARNQADSLIYVTEKTLKEMGDKISEDTKKSVESAVEDLKKALEGEDFSEIRSKTERLIEESQKIGAEIYQQAIAAGAAHYGCTFGVADIVHFGDGPWDVEAAGTLGIRFIGINEDEHGRARLRKAGASHVFPDYRDAAAIRRILG